MVPSAPSQWRPGSRAIGGAHTHTAARHRPTTNTTAATQQPTTTSDATPDSLPLSSSRSESPVVAGPSVPSSSSSSSVSLNIWRPRPHTHQTHGASTRNTNQNNKATNNTSTTMTMASHATQRNGTSGQSTSATSATTSVPASTSASSASHQDLLRSTAMRRANPTNATHSTASATAAAAWSGTPAAAAASSSSSSHRPAVASTAQPAAAATAASNTMPPSSQISVSSSSNNNFSSAGRSFPSFHSTPRAIRSKHFALTQTSPGAGAASAAAAAAAGINESKSSTVPDDEDDGMEKCAICTYPLNDLAVLPCDHYYCLPCISEWFQISTTCPLCKAQTSDLQHFIPPIVPIKIQEMIQQLEAAKTTTTTTTTMTLVDAVKDGSMNQQNPLSLFVKRCVALFHLTHPGITLERLTLPIEQLSTRPRLGLEGHELEDLALAEELQLQDQRYEEFRLGAENSEEEEEDVVCVFCNEPHHPEVLLLCDYCNLGYHTYCLDPPLRGVPPGDWFCPGCIDEVTREIEEKDAGANGTTSSSRDGDHRACAFWGGPTQMQSLTTPPRRTRNGGAVGGDADPRRSAERSEGRKRLEIFIRRTLERRRRNLSLTEQAWARTETRTTSAAAPPAAVAPTGPHASATIAIANRARQTAKNVVQRFNSLSALFGQGTMTQYDHANGDDDDDDDDDSDQIDYDAYGRSTSPPPSKKAKLTTSKHTSSSSTSTMHNKRSRVDTESATDDSSDSDAHRKVKSKKKKSTDKNLSKHVSNGDSRRPKKKKRLRKIASTDDDNDDDDRDLEEDVIVLDHSLTLKRSSSKSASSSSNNKKKKKNKNHRIDDDDDDDDLSDFIQYDDDLIPATPSSDSDGAKASFLPTQRDNKASRRMKLAKNKSTINEAIRHRQRVMDGKLSSSSSLSSESDDDSDDRRRRQSMNKKSHPSHNNSAPSSRPVAHFLSTKNLSKSSSSLTNKNVPSHMFDDDDTPHDLEDVTSFDATQQERRQRLPPTSSLDRLSSPTSANASKHRRTTTMQQHHHQSTALHAKRSLQMVGPTHTATNGSYRLPLQTVSSNNKSRRSPYSSSHTLLRDDADESDGSAVDHVRPRSSTPPPLPLTTMMIGQEKKRFIKQQLSHRHVTTQPPPPPASSSSSHSNGSFDDDRDDEDLPTSSPNSPVLHTRANNNNNNNNPIVPSSFTARLPPQMNPYHQRRNG